MKYVKATANVLVFDNSDVITTSNCSLNSTYTGECLLNNPGEGIICSSEMGLFDPGHGEEPGAGI